MNNLTKDYYEKVGDKYADWSEKKYSEFSSLFDEVSWLQFSEFLPADKTAGILDAGCGGGAWSLRLAKMGYTNITCIDLSSSCISGAKRIFEKHDLITHAQFYVADISDLSIFETSTFDFVFCERDPLEYCCEMQETAFSELIRVLKDQGIITLSTGTSYRIKQKLIAAKLYNDFFEFEKTGMYLSEEGYLKPLNSHKIKTLFSRYNIEKLKIAGRLTVTDCISDDDWEEIYSNPELKDKILDIEQKYEKDESLADFSSHIFAAGRKNR